MDKKEWVCPCGTPHSIPLAALGTYKCAFCQQLYTEKPPTEAASGVSDASATDAKKTKAPAAQE